MLFRSPYILPGGCLRNKLNITGATLLANVEARVVSARDVEIATSLLPGEYDLEHYQRFHYTLFRDIYDWAGKLRTVRIAKGDTDFGPPQFVAEQMSAVLAELDRDRWLIGRARESLLERLAHYYGEINARHPFREGNGRTLRAFLRQLCVSAGWRLDWSALDREANIAASAHSFHTGKYDRLVEVLDPVVHRI